MLDAGAAVFLVTSPANVRYLTGFTGSAGVLALSVDGHDRLFTNFLYQTQVTDELDPAVEAVIASQPLLVEARSALAGEPRVAFESAHLSVAEWEIWRAAEGPELEAVTGWAEALRAVKAPEEMDAIERAATAADLAFADILGEVMPGVTERALAARLDWLLVAYGAERPAFETIVAFGERSALPHAAPTGRALESGEVVLFDFGAIVDGYASDMTRTVSCGAPDPRLAEIYAVVLRAQSAALEGLVAGITGREADALARDLIEAAGHGEHFGHSLGHGIGLEVHEDPRLGKKSETELETGMVVTVEPGIYIEGLGGVRIEDDAAVGPDGARVLTHAPKGGLITTC
ncbi:Xaa-Pro peptidase family protein [soil metagenome]